MEETRQIRSDFYPLMRDVRNLHTFTTNIHNILQASPEPFALAAPPGLITVRNAVKGLVTSVSAIKEVNELAAETAELAEQLNAELNMPVLQPSGRLLRTAMDLKYSIDEADAQLAKFHGYLVPLFVFTLACCPVIDLMFRQVRNVEKRVLGLKKIITWLTDQELTSGLPGKISVRLQKLHPELRILEADMSDITDQMSEVVLRMDKLSILNAKLEPLIRMAIVMDTAMQDLTPTMSLLKQLHRVLVDAKRKPDPQSQQSYVEFQFANIHFPEDALLQLRFQLVEQIEHYIRPVLLPLGDLGAHIKKDMPTSETLNSMESLMTAQQTRFSRAYKRLDILCQEFDQLFKDAKDLTHAA